MKRIIALMSGALLLVAGLCASCQKELGSQDEKSTTVGEVVVKATIAGNDTKVSFTVDGTNNKLKTAWEESDNIIGWDADGNKIELAIASIEDNGKTAIFKKVDNSANIPTSGKVYMIYAPDKHYSDITTDKTLVYDLSNQNLDKVPALMTATGTVTDGVLELSFTNRLAIVAVKNPKFPASAANKTITGLKLSGTNILTTATFSLDTDNELQMMSSDQGDITRGCNITPTAGGTTDKTVYFAVLPNNTQANVTISTTTPEGYQISFSNKSFKASQCYLLANTVCLPAGALPGVFTVSNDGGVTTTQIRFSKGNLFYDGSKFRFEANQYDIMPSSNSSWSLNHISHFFWSKDARVAYSENYNTANSTYEITPGNNDVFFTNATATTAKEGFTVNVDGKEQSGWRTLSTKEWQYLFNTRAASKVSDIADARYAKATVNNKAGIILLPDTYSHPSGVADLTNINTKNAAFTANNYGTEDLEKMETAGCVFLPAAGYRGGSYVSLVGGSGGYWSSTAYDESYAYDVYFFSSDVYPDDGGSRLFGYSVRLITESN